MGWSYEHCFLIKSIGNTKGTLRQWELVKPSHLLLCRG
jgi:hypothetical protein